ncbi:M23 family metallopeptidase [Alkalicoccobacillus plakortidis]|uniref:M23 family metallopeptidase n=1 Tax=Alkalicoccobacillus plakortidis TaxID=444060 RepID=A0ABT0XGY9_9BACI|nr:M23 family metallopeptidase [Alkalicoccobacillus plakortidis]MCM2675158.1 M23 family metallopeptidase [Alkalicoccobacillus plakortidis]
MSKQLQQVRKRIEAKRKTNRGYHGVETSSKSSIRQLNSNVKEVGTSFDPEGESSPKRYVGSFVLRTLFCTLIFLSLLIIYRTDQARLEPVREVVSQTFEQEFQFAAISQWYESNFGRPITLLPPKTTDQTNNPAEPPVELTPYAVPATGTIRENFDQNGRGVMIETGEGIEVHAATGGYITDVTEKEDTGKTVILQHYDGTESTYGMLDEITVNIYDHIQAGHELGTVSKSEDNKGIYYFALKKGEEYINPNEVISFE